MLPTDFVERFETALASFYDEKEEALNEAILYSLLGPGKRLRPKLAYLCALAIADKRESHTWEMALPAMKAVEMVHCYSLVHDDLPSMDNDDYRRGRLSCHKKYSESTAILVGDALIADAFEVLSTAQNNAALLVKELARAIGSRGMVLGQKYDLSASHTDNSWEQWRRIHALKTGCLFEAACVMGGLSVNASVSKIEQLRQFARSFGIAFQLRDDLIDDASTVNLFGRGRIESLLQEQIELAAKIAISSEFNELRQVAEQLRM